MSDYSHQSRCHRDLDREIAAGQKRICVTSPTGSGKSYIIKDRFEMALKERKPVVCYTHRRILFDQLTALLDRYGVSYGKRASGHKPALLRDAQVAQLPTEVARFDRDDWQPHEAQLVLVDEAHSNKSDGAKKVLDWHLDRGATLIGFTATPLNIGHIYDCLIVAGTPSQLRAQNVLVPCDVYAPSEFDLSSLRVNSKTGEYSQQRAADVIWGVIQQGPARVFGNVFHWYLQLNPCKKPTVLFAPGVRESRWFRDQFERQGVTAAHIDAETPQDDRDRIFKAVASGEIKVLCNMAVLREGWNLPAIEHCILCQPCGALTTYLQIVGRILRVCEGKKRATLQDHVGAWHRHGSPNQDRRWNLNQTDRGLQIERKERLESGEEREPIRCPDCGRPRLKGDKCPFCGREHKKSVRVVIMQDGRLEKKYGSVVKRKHRQEETDFVRWRKILFGGLQADRTMKECLDQFRFKHEREPCRAELGDLPCPLPSEKSFYNRVRAELPDWWEAVKSRRKQKV